VIDLSSMTGFLAARTGLGAARLRETAARNDVALATRRQFYEVVRAIHLGVVAQSSLRLARDDERRVRALYEVGSVSRSDLLSAQVRRAQSELDSLTANQSIAVQRILLANQIGIPERELGELDTLLTVEPQTYDPAELLAEAERNRPDLRAAEAELKAANGDLRAARLARLPYVSVSGSLTWNPRFDQTTRTDTLAGQPTAVSSFHSEDDREWRGAVSLNWNLFNLGTDSRIASARGRAIRARDTRDVLRRDLAHEVQQALLDYRVALERQRVARSAIESATENLNLTQQKYNVGSATILELIDAQVQLQRAQSDGVSAQAATRVAEAQIERVRGRGE
jgi:outer membrane protein TolC